MSFTLIQNGEVYSPARLGIQSVLVDDEKILKVGQVDARKVQELEIPSKVIDASGCIVIPGIIDPHSHIIGGGGEHGFNSRMPELSFTQLVEAGITTVVGLLGTDTTTRHLASLYAKCGQIFEEGLTAFMYTGGFELPPQHITGSVKDDLVMIDKVIGAGEVALSDERWIDPKLHDLAHLVSETMLGGMQAGKAGVTHFHIGGGKKRVCLLHELLDEYDLSPACLYITHIERSHELIDDAIKLAKRGAYVDMDTTEQKLAEDLIYYLHHGGPKDHLTVSSDSNTPGGSPEKLFSQLTSCVRDAGMAWEDVLPLFTQNVANVLKLKNKGQIKEKKDADIAVLRRDTLEIVHLFARGEAFIENGEVIKKTQQKYQEEQGKA